MDESTAGVPSKSNPEVTQKKQKMDSKSGLPGNHGVSNVWNHFTKHLVEGTKKYSGVAECNYCHTKVDAPSAMGTNKQRTHLRNCREYKSVEADHTTQSLISFGAGQPSNWVFNQEKCRHSLAKMIILDELPFSIVDKEGFKSFCQELQPKFHVVCRSTITKDCIKLYFEEKSRLKTLLQTLPSRVCLTTDMWTSLQNLGYMVVTAHYVDKDWILRKKIINFRVIPHPHRGEVIAKAVEGCLLEWGLEKVMTITLDNAKNNDSCVVDLKRRLANRNLLLMGGDYIHVRCFAHVINLVVRDGIEEAKVIVKQLRRCVKYVRSSPSRLQEFKKCIHDEKLTSKRSVCIDVKTRWNSTYLMIDVALEFEKAFETLKDRDLAFRYECDVIGEGLLDGNAWKKLRTLHTFLEEFYELTNRVSGSKYATSNTYFDEVTQVKDLLMEHLGSKDEWIRKMVKKMDEKFEKYCNFESLNLVLVIAMVLDPRYKLQYVEFWYSEYLKKKFELTKGSNLNEDELHQISIEVEIYVKKLRDLMNDLYSLYKLETSMMDIEPRPTQEENVVNNVEKVIKRPKAKDLFRGSLKRKEYGEGMNDLDKYLADGVVEEDASHFDVLSWWKDKVSTYRVLAMVARDVLAIPVTSVASECAFSTAGRVLDPFRSSLTPTIVECLISTQDWLRSPIPPVSVEEKLETLEEIEQVMANQMKALDLGSSS